MRVLLNALKLDEGPHRRFGGNYFLAHHLAVALAERTDLDLTVLCDEHTQPQLQADIPDSLLKFCPLRGGGVLAADAAVMRSLRELTPDVYHRPTGQLPLRLIVGKTIATIGDLHHFLVFPTPWIRKIYKHISYRWTAYRATRLTCVSQYTRNHVIRYLKVDPQKVTVVYNGANPLPQPQFGVADRLGLHFWVAFGHQPYKNVESAVKALQKRPLNERLVVLGENRYIETVIKPLAASCGVAGRVNFAGYVSREELHGLLIKSLGLLFLSTHEGFGLPVLEAMLAKCPVVSSNACSLPEAAGPAAQMVAPDDICGIVRAMQRLVEDRLFRGCQIQLGLEHAAYFTWKRAAEETVLVYRRALEHKQ